MERLRTAAHVGERRLCRFLHHVTELPREDEFALPAQDVDLRPQHIAADLRPRKPCDDADEWLLLLPRRMVLRTFQKLRKVRLRHGDGRRLPFDDAPRCLAAELSHDALQLAHPRLARIGADEHRIDACTDADVLCLQPVLYALTRQEMPPCDLDLLHLRIAREIQDLHAVTQRRRNARGVICRDDPEHLREVKRQLHEVIAERAVLGRVKNLKKRSRRIAMKVHGNLVHLI